MPTNLRDTIARQFLYETGMFDSPAEIGANPEHRLVVIAYKAADRILTFLRDDDRLALSRALCPEDYAVVPREPTERVTIAELEAILAAEDDAEIDILPDGSIRPRKSEQA